MVNLSSNYRDSFLEILFFIDPIPLQFENYLQPVSRLDRKAGDNVQFDCKFTGRPKPTLVWFKGKLPLSNSDSTLQFNDNNGR
jgi:hypothetical protein